MGTWFERKGERGIMTVRTEQQEGVVGVSDMVDIDQPDTSFSETVVDRMEWQFVGRERDGAFRVLSACEAFFLGCRDHLPISNETSSGVMVHSVDSESIHASSLLNYENIGR
jgi:hypothetical protein